MDTLNLWDYVNLLKKTLFDSLKQSPFLLQILFKAFEYRQAIIPTENFRKLSWKQQ